MNLGDLIFQTNKTLAAVGNQALTPAMDAAGTVPAGSLLVCWNTVAGGTLNPSTGAIVGGVATTLSGTLTAIGVEEPARSVVRQYAEIAVGDLVVTLPGNPQVVLGPGQPLSGTLPLSSLALNGAWFVWQGRTYSQKEISDDLRTLWSDAVAGIPLAQGLLLRRAV